MKSLRAVLALILVLTISAPARSAEYPLERALISDALKEYVKVFETGKARGWTKRDWIDATALRFVPARDAEFLWKQVSLHGPLLPATVDGTKLLITSADHDKRGLQTTEIDYRDIAAGKLYVNGSPYHFGAFDPLQKIFERDFTGALEKHRSARQSWNLRWLGQLWRSAHAQGCTKQDMSVTANTGMAALSLAQTAVNPASLCARTAVALGVGSHSGFQKNSLKEGVKGFSSVLGSELYTFQETAAYCKARWGDGQATAGSPINHDK